MFDGQATYNELWFIKWLSIVLPDFLWWSLHQLKFHVSALAPNVFFNSISTYNFLGWTFKSDLDIRKNAGHVAVSIRMQMFVLRYVCVCVCCL